MPPVFSLIQSILAAFFGVQSEKKRLEDFQKTSPLPFIITGIVMTLLMISILIILARKLA